MEEVLTRKGVLIDVCPSCKGVWLDQGELNFFTQNKKILNHYEIKGLEANHKIVEKCPKCQSQMQAGRLPGFPHQVEECLTCKGIFFDAHEFKKFEATKEFKTLRRDYIVSRERAKKTKTLIPLKIPSLSFTTGVVCFSLYGVLFALIVFLMETMKLSILSGFCLLLLIIAVQFYFSPIFMDWWLKTMGSLEWMRSLERLPPFFKKSLLRLCSEHKIPIPKVGIIHDSSPEAYTYGRTPKSARLVFSRGMFELLDEGEVEAVLAHELGHIKHWDFVVMTVMQLVPLLLYTVYKNIRVHLLKKGKVRKGRGLAAALVVSYVAYLVADYMVLFVSRVREYYADQFSCFATKKPNKLLTALIKISYGLLRNRDVSDTESGFRKEKMKGVEALNIMNISHSKQLALASQGEDEGHFNPEVIKEIMRWDLWSPWAFYYEIHSTHPLTAKRINAIGSHALSLKQEPYLLFDKEKPESYWDDFFWDLFILYLPYILGISGILASFYILHGADFSMLSGIKQDLLSTAGLPAYSDTASSIRKGFFASLGKVFFSGVLGLSVGAFIRLLKTYPSGRFLHYSVASLLKLIKVSPVRSYPVSLKGRILGRGEAGSILSEDFILRDKTGIIYLNHEPFGLNILFALFRYKQFQGKEVKVTGWYRRSPSPYVEVKAIRSVDGVQSKAYTYHYKMAFCLLAFLASLIYLF